jgi:hypothetical protein
MAHGFFTMTGTVDAAATAIAQAARHLRRCFTPPAPAAARGPQDPR